MNKVAEGERYLVEAVELFYSAKKAEELEIELDTTREFRRGSDLFHAVTIYEVKDLCQMDEIEIANSPEKVAKVLERLDYSNNGGVKYSKIGEFKESPKPSSARIRRGLTDEEVTKLDELLNLNE